MPNIRLSLLVLLVHQVVAHPPAWERVTPTPTSSTRWDSMPLTTAQPVVGLPVSPTTATNNNIIAPISLRNTDTDDVYTTTTDVNDHTSSILYGGAAWFGNSPIETPTTTTGEEVDSVLQQPQPTQPPGNFWHNAFGNSSSQIVSAHLHKNVTGFAETNREHADKLQRPKGPVERGISPKVNEPCGAMEKFDEWIENTGNGRVNIAGEQPISFDFSYKIELWPCEVGNTTAKASGKPAIIEGKYKALDQLESEKGPMVARQSSLDISSLNCPQKYHIYDNSKTCSKIPAVGDSGFCKLNFTAQQDPLETSIPTIRLIFGTCSQDQAATSLWVKALHGTPPIWTFAGLTAENNGPHAAALSMARKQLPVTKDFEPGSYDLKALQSHGMIPSLQPKAIEARRQGIHNAGLGTILAVFEPEENYGPGTVHYWSSDNPKRNSPAGYAAWKNDKDWAVLLRQLEEMDVQ